MPNNFESFNNSETHDAELPVPQVPPELTRKFGSMAYASYLEGGVSEDKRPVPELTETLPQEAVEGQTEDPIAPVLHELDGVEWHTPSPASADTVEEPVAESSVDSEETDPAAHESFARRTLARARQSRIFGTVLAVGLAAIMAASLVACGNGGQSSAPEATSATVEVTALAGEQANGVRYDYSHYADKAGKESTNAYDYSLADCYGDREATAQGIMDVAKRTPEALASYAFTILTPEEKAELDLTGKTMVEIDDKMSNDPDGGVLQQQIIEKLDNALNDKNTIFKFYKENDFETSSYVYFVDSNKDGVYSPDELHLGYADVKRNGSPQVDIMRPVKNNRPLASGTSSSGEWETASYQIVDINLSCGGQVNYGQGEFPPGVPYVDPDDENPGQNPTESETQSATEWGKSGDPHGGPDVTYSDKVDPDAEVSKEQNDNTNKGNQGYVDDNHATPGSGSENNGTNGSGYASSDIVAPGASTNESRLSGGENQGGSQTNGSNAYNSPESIAQGQQVDNSGNAAQAEAQTYGGENGGGAAAGGDNYSDSGEENAIENGDF